MTPEQTRAVAQKYIEGFRGHGEESKRFTLNGQLPTPQQARAHVWWMCKEIVDFCQPPFNPGKAHRWLGFVQGVLWILGDKTIDQMRDDNRSG